MRTDHFSPLGQPRPCWHCTHFDRIEPAGCCLCARPYGVRQVAMPASGCVFWMRVTGVDDEPGRVPEFASSIAPGAQVWKATEATLAKVPVRWAQ